MYSALAGACRNIIKELTKNINRNCLGREVCDIAQRNRKETRLKALCNVFVFLSFSGIIWLAIAKSKTGILCGYALAEIGAFGGILFGDALERVQKPYKAVKRDKHIGNGKYDDMYIPEYPFAQYLKDNSTTAKEVACILEEQEDTGQMLHHVYENYRKSARGARVQPLEQVANIIFRKGRVRRWRQGNRHSSKKP